MTEIQNSADLKYYLIQGAPPRFLSIYMQKTIQFCDKNIELAIIGSSHFIYLENQFSEILSCHDFEVDEKNKIQIVKKADEKPVFFETKNLRYSFTMIIKMLNPIEFLNFEEFILHSNFTLKMAFLGTSAWTVVDAEEILPNKLRILTIHTYPENDSVVFTTSLIRSSFL